MRRLRTFLAMPIMTAGSRQHYLTSKVVYELVPELKCLRALSLAGYQFGNLPRTIGGLKLLRYLNLSHTQIIRLPESVADALQEMPPRIGNFSNLHTLTKFIVGKNDGQKLIELKNLTKLLEELRIEGLQNVVDIRDAEFANLKEKDGLQELYLKWTNNSSGSRNLMDEVQVLNALRPPHQNLSSLSIEGFGGSQFPSWTGDPIFANMVKLSLCKCSNITSLPPIGGLSSLRELSIRDMDSVKEVGTELYGNGSLFFPSLDTLTIENMREWEHWTDNFNDMNEEAVLRFPKLRHLAVINCPKLVAKFPKCLPSLQKLELRDCQAVFVRSMSNFTSLTSLCMHNISGLVDLDEVHIQDLETLEDLMIGHCDELMYLWKDGTILYKLACLKSLWVWYCKQMVSLVEGEEGDLPCNLQVLRIDCCNNLEKLPNGLHRLTYLRDLKIYQCFKLKSFPTTGVPYGLRNLWINSCDSLVSLPLGIITSDGNLMSQLETLTTLGCSSLKSSPSGQFPNSIKTLQIEDCNWLTAKLALPSGFSHLTGLHIINCSQLE